MRKLVLALIIGLAATLGCQTSNGPYGSTYPQGQPGLGYQPGYEQTFPPQVAGPAPGQFGKKTGQFLGDLAGGFFRSAVGGAGFTAGRDLWNTIVN